MSEDLRPGIKPKTRLRFKIQKMMQEEHYITFPREVTGRVPNFKGAKEAAEQLVATEQFQKSSHIVMAPDMVLQNLRILSINENKTIYTPSQNLTEGLFKLDRSMIPEGKERHATTIKNIDQYAEKIQMWQLEKIDLMVVGAVAVDKNGGFISRGGGTMDHVFALLKEQAKEPQLIAALAHPAQVVDDIPMEAHDIPLNIIATPEEIIMTENIHPRPPGIIWELLKDKN